MIDRQLVIRCFANWVCSGLQHLFSGLFGARTDWKRANQTLKDARQYQMGKKKRALRPGMEMPFTEVPTLPLLGGSKNCFFTKGNRHICTRDLVSYFFGEKKSPTRRPKRPREAQREMCLDPDTFFSTKWLQFWSAYP